MACELSSIPQQSPRLREPKGTVIRRRIGNSPPPSHYCLLGPIKLGAYLSCSSFFIFPETVPSLYLFLPIIAGCQADITRLPFSLSVPPSIQLDLAGKSLPPPSWRLLGFKNRSSLLKELNVLGSLTCCRLRKGE